MHVTIVAGHVLKGHGRIQLRRVTSQKATVVYNCGGSRLRRPRSHTTAAGHVLKGHGRIQLRRVRICRGHHLDGFWFRVGVWTVPGWSRPGSWLVSAWVLAGLGFVSGWSRLGFDWYRWTSGLFLVGLGWSRVGFWLVSAWFLAGLGLVSGWLLSWSRPGFSDGLGLVSSGLG